MNFSNVIFFLKIMDILYPKIFSNQVLMTRVIWMLIESSAELTKRASSHPWWPTQE